jgi:hypothetical protein
MANKSIQDEMRDYAAMFVALKEIIDETTYDILMTRPEPAKWSMKELLCHIADTELLMTLRMKMIIAEDNPTLMKFDQEKWAEQSNYMEWDLKETLLLFGLLRSAMAGILQNLPEAAWKRTGRYEDGESKTLRDILDDSNQHCKHHLTQMVAAKMKLEK